MIPTLGCDGDARQSDRLPLVIDTDPGIDDVVTLALAARSPSLDIVAVTTTYGNAPLDATTRNAHEVLRLAGRSDIPVWPGCDRPLVRSLTTAPQVHGITGVGYAPVPSPSQADGTPNDRVLLDILSRCPEPVILVTLGPLTNLARALEEDCDVVQSRICQHIGMFGSLTERGSVDRWADFNAWCDPEAVDHVLRAGMNTHMVGLDVTRRMVLSRSEVSALASSSDALVKWLGQALQFSVEAHAERLPLNGCVVNDVLTVGELLSPGMLRFVTHRLRVDPGDGEHRGRTRADSNGFRTLVAVEADTDRMHTTLARVLGNDGLAQWIVGGSR
jgi:inosine-uridine nucleoside N-ribohydrolase